MAKANGKWGTHPYEVGGDPPNTPQLMVSHLSLIIVFLITYAISLTTVWAHVSSTYVPIKPNVILSLQMYVWFGSITNFVRRISFDKQEAYMICRLTFLVSKIGRKFFNKD
jgi:hypothetical protein